MAKIAYATLQPAWDCRWSSPGYRLTGVREARQPETRWVCTREGHRRLLSDDECLTCEYWELDSASTADVEAAAPAALAAGQPRIERVLDLSLRATLLMIAAMLVATGAVILTRPLALPFTILLWLGAAGAAMLAAFGEIQERDTEV